MNQVRYASLKGIMAAKKKPIDVKSVADLGLAGQVGEAAAKVKIEKLYTPPKGSGRRDAVGLGRRSRRQAGRQDQGAGASLAPREMSMGSILVVAEIQKGKIREASYELVSFARKIGAATSREVKSLVMGQGAAAHAEEMAKKGGGEVFLADDAALANYNLDAAFAAVKAAIAAASADVVLLSNTPTGWDLAPRIAAALDAAFVSDCFNAEVEGSEAGLLPPLLQRQARLAAAPHRAARRRDDAAGRHRRVRRRRPTARSRRSRCRSARLRHRSSSR